jgi:hypothetical protein
LENPAISESDGNCPDAYYFEYLSSNKSDAKYIIAIGNQASGDIGIIFCNQLNEWFNAELEDGCGISMPFVDDNVSYPVGMTLNFSSNVKIDGHSSDSEKIPPSPILIVATNTGILLAFHCILSTVVDDSYYSTMVTADIVEPVVIAKDVSSKPNILQSSKVIISEKFGASPVINPFITSSKEPAASLSISQSFISSSTKNVENSIPVSKPIVSISSAKPYSSSPLSRPPTEPASLPSAESESSASKQISVSKFEDILIALQEDFDKLKEFVKITTTKYQEISTSLGRKEVKGVLSDEDISSWNVRIKSTDLIYKEIQDYFRRVESQLNLSRSQSEECQNRLNAINNNVNVVFQRELAPDIEMFRDKLEEKHSRLLESMSSIEHRMNSTQKVPSYLMISSSIKYCTMSLDNIKLNLDKYQKIYEGKKPIRDEGNFSIEGTTPKMKRSGTFGIQGSDEFADEDTQNELLSIDYVTEKNYELLKFKREEMKKSLSQFKPILNKSMVVELVDPKIRHLPNFPISKEKAKESLENQLAQTNVVSPPKAVISVPQSLPVTPIAPREYPNTANNQIKPLGMSTPKQTSNLGIFSKPTEGAFADIKTSQIIKPVSSEESLTTKKIDNSIKASIPVTPIAPSDTANNQIKPLAISTPKQTSNLNLFSNPTSGTFVDIKKTSQIIKPLSSEASSTTKIVDNAIKTSGLFAKSIPESKDNSIISTKLNATLDVKEVAYQSFSFPKTSEAAADTSSIFSKLTKPNVDLEDEETADRSSAYEDEDEKVTSEDGSFNSGEEVLLNSSVEDQSLEFSEYLSESSQLQESTPDKIDSPRNEPKITPELRTPSTAFAFPLYKSTCTEKTTATSSQSADIPVVSLTSPFSVEKSVSLKDNSFKSDIKPSVENIKHIEKSKEVACKPFEATQNLANKSVDVHDETDYLKVVKSVENIIVEQKKAPEAMQSTPIPIAEKPQSETFLVNNAVSENKTPKNSTSSKSTTNTLLGNEIIGSVSRFEIAVKPINLFPSKAESSGMLDISEKSLAPHSDIITSPEVETNSTRNDMTGGIYL